MANIINTLRSKKIDSRAVWPDGGFKSSRFFQNLRNKCLQESQLKIESLLNCTKVAFYLFRLLLQVVTNTFKITTGHTALES